MLDDLGELRFREAEFQLERSEPDRIEVSHLFVESPQLLIDASGSLALAPKRPLLLSPLDVSATLAASGDVEILFDGMGLLEDEDNEAGYRELTRTVRLGGTPTKPDTSAFRELLEEAANNSGGALGAGLRALNRRL